MEVEAVEFLAGQDGSVSAQEVMVLTWVEIAVLVSTEAAKAEAANKATTENCILIV